MKNSIFYYFIERIGFYILSFLSFYFRDSLFFLFSFYKSFAKEIERTNGFVIHLKYFFTPLWNIYSIPAYILSIPIRLFKITIGLFLQVLVILLVFLIYIGWLLLPWSFLINRFFKIYKI
ncbi:MAG: hypothetical protein AB7D02_01205 [Candidatus Paceibacterota bacterium]